MAKTNRKDNEDDKMLHLVAVLAWLIPGAGHFYLGKRTRGAVIFVSICTTFLLGLILGGIEVIDPQGTFGAKAWFFAQILAGFPAILASLAQNPNLPMGYGRGVDLGQVYAGVAGLLNLLCVVDILTGGLAPEPPELKQQEKGGAK